MAPGVRHSQRIERAPVFDYKIGFVDDSRIVFTENYLCAASFGERRIVEVNHASVVSKPVHAVDQRVGHPGRVVNNLRHLHPGVPDRKHERLRNHWHPVGNFAIQYRHAPLERIHFPHRSILSSNLIVCGSGGELAASLREVREHAQT
jgi:hypothetical protein